MPPNLYIFFYKQMILVVYIIKSDSFHFIVFFIIYPNVSITISALYSMCSGNDGLNIYFISAGDNSASADISSWKYFTWNIVNLIIITYHARDIHTTTLFSNNISERIEVASWYLTKRITVVCVTSEWSHICYTRKLYGHVLSRCVNWNVSNRDLWQTSFWPRD